ncbi:MAG: DUF5667 domain-containing protein [Candidatus Peregrinibacteria bacterium]
MSAEDLLRRLRGDCAPSAGAQERIAKRFAAIQRAPHALKSVRIALEPTPASRLSVWAHIASDLSAAHANSVLNDVRSWIAAAGQSPMRILRPALENLPTARKTSHLYRSLTWTAAFVLIAFVVHLAPTVLWAPSSVASSELSFTPTRGEAYVLMGELWQPVVGTLALKTGMQLKTGNGEASVVLGDTGVIRMDSQTTITLLDLSDHLTPSEPVSTVALVSGRIWIQGLLPGSLPGITISSRADLVTVNEGSVSLERTAQSLSIEALDRSASVTHDGKEYLLVSGDRSQARDGSALAISHISSTQYKDAWIRDNLSRDAVHRQEIASLQQARLAERAGILPTSRLYSMKRAVEAVDLFLTLGEESRVQKKIEYADSRLNEAAALLAKGETGAVTLPLEEYRGTLVALATGSGDATLAQFLLRQAVSQSAGELAATLPGDQAYIIKKVVMETSSLVTDDAAHGQEVRADLLLDALSVLTQTVEEGNLKGVEGMWKELRPQLSGLRDHNALVSADTSKEVTSAMAMLALSIEKQKKESSEPALDAVSSEEIAAYLPPDDATAVLSASEIQTMVTVIKQRIFLYHYAQPRINQFTMELKNLETNPDQGRILRRLYFALPGGPESFPERVRQEILRLSWKNTKAVHPAATGTGAAK